MIRYLHATAGHPVKNTWLEEDEFDTVIGGYHVFRHNSPIDSTGRNHLFRGVAIVLSPRYYLAWRAAGSPSPITTTAKTPAHRRRRAGEGTNTTTNQKQWGDGR